MCRSARCPDPCGTLNAVAGLLEQFAIAHPGGVTRRGGETFVEAELVVLLVDEAQRRGIAILGLEGFLIDDESVYPSLSHVADFSGAEPEEAWAAARALLAGPWSSPPAPDDQINSSARGRYMLAVVLADDV